jgi:hypothetical protein
MPRLPRVAAERNASEVRKLQDMPLGDARYPFAKYLTVFEVKYTP